MSLTKSGDIDRKILSHLSDKDLINMSSVSKWFLSISENYSRYLVYQALPFFDKDKKYPWRYYVFMLNLIRDMRGHINDIPTFIGNKCMFSTYRTDLIVDHFMKTCLDGPLNIMQFISLMCNATEEQINRYQNKLSKVEKITYPDVYFLFQYCSSHLVRWSFDNQILHENVSFSSVNNIETIKLIHERAIIDINCYKWYGTCSKILIYLLKNGFKLNNNMFMSIIYLSFDQIKEIIPYCSDEEKKHIISKYIGTFVITEEILYYILSNEISYLFNQTNYIVIYIKTGSKNVLDKLPHLSDKINVDISLHIAYQQCKNIQYIRDILERGYIFDDMQYHDFNYDIEYVMLYYEFYGPSLSIQDIRSFNIEIVLYTLEKNIIINIQNPLDLFKHIDLGIIEYFVDVGYVELTYEQFCDSNLIINQPEKMRYLIKKFDQITSDFIMSHCNIQDIDFWYLIYEHSKGDKDIMLRVADDFEKFGLTRLLYPRHMLFMKKYLNANVKISNLITIITTSYNDIYKKDIWELIDLMELSDEQKMNFLSLFSPKSVGLFCVSSMEFLADAIPRWKIYQPCNIFFNNLKITKAILKCNMDNLDIICGTDSLIIIPYLLNEIPLTQNQRQILIKKLQNIQNNVFIMANLYPIPPEHEKLMLEGWIPPKKILDTHYHYYMHMLNNNGYKDFNNEYKISHQNLIKLADYPGLIRNLAKMRCPGIANFNFCYFMDLACNRNSTAIGEISKHVLFYIDKNDLYFVRTNYSESVFEDSFKFLMTTDFAQHLKQHFTVLISYALNLYNTRLLDFFMMYLDQLDINMLLTIKQYQENKEVIKLFVKSCMKHNPNMLSDVKDLMFPMLLECYNEAPENIPQ